MYQIAHTLIVAGFVAGSGYMAVKSEISTMRELYDKQEVRLNKIEAKADKVELRQASVISQADEIHSDLKARMAAVERRR